MSQRALLPRVLLLAALVLAAAFGHARAGERERPGEAADRNATEAVTTLLRQRGLTPSGPPRQRGKVFVIEARGLSGATHLIVIDPMSREIAGEKLIRR
jgi:hypothetical protein